MSINVKALILHRLELNQEGLLVVTPRHQTLPATEAVTQLIAELHASYAAKPGKGFAAFNDSGSSFAEALANYLDGQSEFVPFSLQAADLLQAQLNQYGLVETGYLLLAHYQHLAVDKLLVMQLKAQESVTITDALDLGQTRFLELKSLQLAASVDLTAWQVEPERRQYISFVRGRAGRKVSDFFLDFLGCVEGVDAKAQSKALLTAVDDYCAAAGLEGEERQDLGKQVFSYCKEKAASGEEVTVAELSDSLPPWEGESRFADFAAQGDYGLEDKFPVEQSALKALVKFSGTGAGVTISFEEKHLGERVIYDMATDTLTIKGIPANLRDQLKRRLGEH
ncbi:nucleoid-associated protein YejK [Gallaecimonas xiamenensis]|uniref:Nucleoid-associated protein NdpA n=1 Tax=Gallaecimonas xiamenensis 3-C-1 TaxID=745411 RepID=K2JAV8_9GAMM|nr:nucleoid-associated protein YejK [Gallaecimonas xiamenensis]EKE72248.1 nucleoid-associated protein NdpA [Gallaecimonas xiamenensis 3-C-1]